MSVSSKDLLVTKKRCIDICDWHVVLPYSGKFSYGADFCIFHMNALHAKIKKNYKDLNV